MVRDCGGSLIDVYVSMTEYEYHQSSFNVQHLKSIYNYMKCSFVFMHTKNMRTKIMHSDIQSNYT